MVATADGARSRVYGKPRNVEAAVGIYMADTLVRIEMRVLG